MAILFFDSSAVVKRYIAETGSQRIAGLILPAANNTVHIGIVTGAEVIAALSRRRRDGSLSPDEAAQAIDEFSDDWANLYDVVSADRQLINQAMSLAQRHGLRGYDAVQLASALEVTTMARQAQATCTFISADDELNTAAVAEGLQVENPDLYP